MTRPDYCKEDTDRILWGLDYDKRDMKREYRRGFANGKKKARRDFLKALQQLRHDRPASTDYIDGLIKELEK